MEAVIVSQKEETMTMLSEVPVLADDVSVGVNRRQITCARKILE